MLRFTYSLVEEHGIIVRATSANEKANIIAFGGNASPVGEMNVKPFISIHRIDKKGKFPLLFSQTFDEMSGSVSILEFVYLAKKPTLLACDEHSLHVFEFKGNKLSLMQKVDNLHGGPINTLGYHRLEIFTGADDKTTAKSTLSGKLIKVPKAPPAF
jgi:hypothetical protein